MRSLVQKIQSAFFLLLAFFAIQNTNAQCSYGIELTATDLSIHGEIFNLDVFGPDVPQQLEWYLPADGIAFSNEASFDLTASAYGDCTICVDYSVTQSNGDICSDVICQNINLLNPFFSCEASFEFQEYAGPMPVVGGITFNNYSTGPYTEWSWDFGDGNFDSQSFETINHFYQESGIYEVRLSVWNGTPADCYSEFTQTVEVFISDDPCEQLDCVWPGDANKDGAASLDDIINIGVGFGMTGPPRDSISNEWDAQASTDWDQSNAEGVNYKHFDCNGDGTIGVNDIIAVQNNFVMLQNGVSATESNGVPISLSFDVDTIVISDSEEEFEINAGLNFGDSNIPMDNIYGVVLYLTYNKYYVSETDPAPVAFDYNENSFFGNTSALPMARNIEEEGQIDIVLTRTNGLNTSGQGRVASVSFVIDADIIDGRIENEGETFSVGINVVKAIDFDGNEIDINLPEEPAGVFFLNGIPTSTIQLLTDSQVKISPNPADENLQVSIDENLHPQSVEILNLLGQRVIFNEMNTVDMNIDVSRLPQGVYIMKVKTEEGIGSKKVIIE